tara:strand:+ start:259 stop:417 length:159 start_codon:yes stop_codon:yes gene_type:complete
VTIERGLGLRVLELRHQSQRELQLRRQSLQLRHQSLQLRQRHRPLEQQERMG